MIDTIPFFPIMYLVGQCVVLLVALEVAIRYFLWWWQIREHDIKIKPIVFWCSVTAIAIALGESNWIYWRVFEPSTHLNVIKALAPGYELSALIHIVLLAGISGMLLPLWALTANMTRAQMLSALIIRIASPLICYFLGLKSAGILECAMHMVCNISGAN